MYTFFFYLNICAIAIWIIQGNLTTKFIRWSGGFGRCNICYSHVQFHSWGNLYLSRLFWVRNPSYRIFHISTKVCNVIWTSKHRHLTWHEMCLPQSLLYVLSSTLYTYFKNTHKKQWTPYLTLIILMSKYFFSNSYYFFLSLFFQIGKIEHWNINREGQDSWHINGN